MQTRTKGKSPGRKKPDPQQLLRDVAAWWAHSVGLIDSLTATANAIAREAEQPDSPLYSATYSENWRRFAGALQDCGAVNCSVLFAPDLPDPLRSLAGKGGAK